MKDNKQRSSTGKVLILILVMYINQTILVAFTWYTGWLAYVKYSSSNDQALAMISPSEESPSTVLNLDAVAVLLASIRLGIADSIMVFHLIFYLFCNQFNYLGMALLDHLQS